MKTKIRFRGFFTYIVLLLAMFAMVWALTRVLANQVDALQQEVIRNRQETITNRATEAANHDLLCAIDARLRGALTTPPPSCPGGTP